MMNAIAPNTSLIIFSPPWVGIAFRGGQAVICFDFSCRKRVWVASFVLYDVQALSYYYLKIIS